jgi:very-short-patch-repair endonuclease
MLKDEFLKDKKCKICELNFDNGNNNQNYIKFCNHLKNEHKISYEKYYVKYYLNNEIPLCACGCGIKPNFFKGKFFKYYSDHKNRIKPSKTTLYKIKKVKEKYNSIENLISISNLNLEQITKSYDSFMNLEKPISVLSRELFIDFRTLKKYWEKLGLIENMEVFKRVSKKSKVKWMVNPIKPDDKILLILKENIFLIKKELVKKDKLTFNEINSIIGVEINKNFLSYFLKQHLSPSELKKIKFIKNSQIEIEFLNVLKFYFGNSVTHNFILENKNFDFKIGRKILIELDGEYWHSKEEVKLNDKIKNKIAEINNYVLIRVSDKEVKNLNFINKIKKIYDEINKI